ncbi:MAG TPA: hypothetical protein VJW23_19820 [Propionibacteriaceae bacterium]|jgi:hypothetical protein|nr:hypothetical protein [Propionibacteriaceae bacterium]
MDHQQVLTLYSIPGRDERILKDFEEWANRGHENDVRQGYYVQEEDEFRYLEGETPEIQDGRMAAFEVADLNTRARAEFALGLFAERLEADSFALSGIFVLLPHRDGP